MGRKSGLWAPVAIDFWCWAAATLSLSSLASRSFDSASRSKAARSSIAKSKAVWVIVVRLAAPTAQTAARVVKLEQGASEGEVGRRSRRARAVAAALQFSGSWDEGCLGGSLEGLTGRKQRR